jgi:dCMP deaminase
MAYVTWPPCSRCTRSLIQAGVSEVIYPKDLEIPERWQKDFHVASSMMEEAGIIVRKA